MSNDLPSGWSWTWTYCCSLDAVRLLLDRLSIDKVTAAKVVPDGHDKYIVFYPV